MVKKWDQDLATQDPSQSLKLEPGTLPKFKIGTPGPPQNLKVEPRDSLQSLKVGPQDFTIL